MVQTGTGGADQIHTNNRQKGKAKTMYRILLVDDEILVRDAIKENIDWKSMDCELVGDCENGKQAADFVKTHPVVLFLPIFSCHIWMAWN